MITKEGLTEAAEDDSVSDNIEPELYEDVPTVTPDLAIEEVLTDSMSSDYSLPVVDEEGHLKGELEREKVADIFAEKSKADTGS
ncbi:L-proline glycine betaine ABC transport system permease protein ProV [Vibrio astriarenae]|nr:L-proline glycine betaine ABC transport system permease protein ProV [Vibrio sp. C7]